MCSWPFLETGALSPAARGKVTSAKIHVLGRCVAGRREGKVGRSGAHGSGGTGVWSLWSFPQPQGQPALPPLLLAGPSHLPLFPSQQFNRVAYRLALAIARLSETFQMQGYRLQQPYVYEVMT